MRSLSLPLSFPLPFLASALSRHWTTHALHGLLEEGRDGVSLVVGHILELGVDLLPEVLGVDRVSDLLKLGRLAGLLLLEGLDGLGGVRVDLVVGKGERPRRGLSGSERGSSDALDGGSEERHGKKDGGGWGRGMDGCKRARSKGAKGKGMVSSSSCW